MATCTITGPLHDINNNVLPNKWIYFTLLQLGTDGTAGVTVPQSSDSVQTDANGDFTIDVWDNGESGVESLLSIRVDGSHPVSVIIPAGTASIELWDLIENYQAADVSPQLPTIADTFLQKANNLSDVTSASTARTNLGLGTAAVTAATAYATAAQGALADSALQSSDIGSTVQAYDAVLDATTASFLIADETKLDAVRLPTTTAVSATSYTVLTTDTNVLVTESAETTITLPAAATAGDGFTVTISKLGSTANVIVDGSGAETINGATTATLTDQDESITLITNGTTWRII